MAVRLPAVRLSISANHRRRCSATLRQTAAVLSLVMGCLGFSIQTPQRFFSLHLENIGLDLPSRLVGSVAVFIER